MYSNSNDTVTDTLFYFMDREKGTRLLLFITYNLLKTLLKMNFMVFSLRVICVVNNINIRITFDLFLISLRAFIRFLFIDED
jgi:hypothetical protein